MIGKFARGRTAIFIDAANIFYSQRTLGWRISYERLREYVAKECDVVSLFVYTATDQSRPEQQKFVAMLKRTGFTVRTKPVKKIRVGNGVYQWKGDFDVELTMDMLDTVSMYDTVVLMSGDSDFAPVIDRVKKLGKQVLVMSVKGHISKELLDRAKYINLKKLRKDIELTPAQNKIPPHEAGRGSS